MTGINSNAKWDIWPKYKKAIDLYRKGKINRMEFISLWHFLQKDAEIFNKRSEEE